MDDQQQLLEDGWQAKDLRTGVAKVFHAAKERSTLGIRVLVAWALVLLVYALMDLVGVVTVAPLYWEAPASLGGLLLSSLAISRAPAPMLIASLCVIVDLVVVGFRFPEVLDAGTNTDVTAAGIRILLAPAALFFVVGGYIGNVSIQAFKSGFSPGTDWRTRMNPLLMQAVVVGSCVLALLAGVGFWLGAVATGFAQTNVKWATRTVLKEPIHMQVGTKPDVEEAETDGKKEGVFAEFEFLKPTQGEEPKGPPKYPETAIPILNTNGLDAYAKREVEDAFEFGADTDEAGCLLEGQGRQDRCRDDRCRYWSRVFTRACFTKSRKSGGFCEAVPEPMAVDAGSTWAVRMCAGRNLELCRQILYAVQGHCHPPTAEQLATVDGSRTPVSPGAPPPEDE